MPNISGTYIIVVKNNKIVSVVKDGKPMTKDVNVPNPNFENDPPTDHKVKHGCVGLGLSYEAETARAQCRWLWGKWF